jgi:hypothetical protein
MPDKYDNLISPEEVDILKGSVKKLEADNEKLHYATKIQ